MDPQVVVNFTCQRCDQPIHLDQGFSHLSQITLAELALPIHSGQELDFGIQKLNKIVTPFKINELSSQVHGFTLVDDPSDNQKSSPLKVTSKLFDLLSSNSDINHPMCEECTDSMLENIDDCIIRLEKQILLYEKLYSSKKDTTKDDTTDLDKELTVLQEEEARLIKELSEVEEEEVEAENVLAKCKKERDRLEEEEVNYWREFISYKCWLTSSEDRNRSTKSLHMFVQGHGTDIYQTNVLMSTFHIWFNSRIGTINSLHLGRLPTIPIPWPEINAAWGQTVLLLDSLARKTNFIFSKYKLKPHGCTSCIEVNGEKKELPLYGSGGIRFLWDHKFDAGMAAFLECLAEFQQYIESKKFQDLKDSKKKFCLPYKINKHHLENVAGSGEMYSIKVCLRRFYKDDKVMLLQDLNVLLTKWSLWGTK